MYLRIILSRARPLNKTEELKIVFLFLNQNICCGYSKEPSQMLKMVGKKIFTFLHSKYLFILTIVELC